MPARVLTDWPQRALIWWKWGDFERSVKISRSLVTSNCKRRALLTKIGAEVLNPGRGFRLTGSKRIRLAGSSASDSRVWSEKTSDSEFGLCYPNFFEASLCLLGVEVCHHQNLNADFLWFISISEKLSWSCLLPNEASPFCQLLHQYVAMEVN
jgi:hypothetical protein